MIAAKSGEKPTQTRLLSAFFLAGNRVPSITKSFFTAIA